MSKQEQSRPISEYASIAQKTFELLKAKNLNMQEIRHVSTLIVEHIDFNRICND